MLHMHSAWHLYLHIASYVYVIPGISRGIPAEKAAKWETRSNKR